MLSAELLKILVCPETKQPIRICSPELLSRLNDGIRAGEVRTRNGSPLGEPADVFLVREDKKIAYRVNDDIPILLIDEGIPLESFSGCATFFAS